VTLERLEALEAAATPGPWTGTTIGNYDQRHAAAAAFETVMARRLADNPDVQFSDLSWVRTPGDDWLNVALVGNGKGSPENAAFIAASRNALPALIAVARAAANLSDHILGGMESRTHLPGDLCARQLESALRALEAEL
jgi:hypothetical protein